VAVAVNNAMLVARAAITGHALLETPAIDPNKVALEGNRLQTLSFGTEPFEQRGD
jgi:hypothetical protein